MPIWPTHLSQIRADASCDRGRGCMRVHGRFFFRHGPIQFDMVRFNLKWFDMGQFGPICAEILV